MCFDKKRWLANVKDFLDYLFIFYSNHDDSLNNYTLSQLLGCVAFLSVNKVILLSLFLGRDSQY